MSFGVTKQSTDDVAFYFPTQGNITMSSFEKHWYKISYRGFVCEMCRVYLLAMKNSEPIKLFSASLIHFINC